LGHTWRNLQKCWRKWNEYVVLRTKIMSVDLEEEKELRIV